MSGYKHNAATQIYAKILNEKVSKEVQKVVALMNDRGFRKMEIFGKIF
jgi:hypothetical protein